MTNEQALDVLRRAIDPLQDAVDNVALDMAFDALKKQIPMKIVDYANRVWFTCPACAERVEDFDNEFEMWKCCPYCGQRIEWGNER